MDALVGEESCCPSQEPSDGVALLIVVGFDVGQPGVPIDRRVQVNIPCPGAAVLVCLAVLAWVLPRPVAYRGHMVHSM